MSWALINGNNYKIVQYLQHTNSYNLNNFKQQRKLIFASLTSGWWTWAVIMQRKAVWGSICENIRCERVSANWDLLQMISDTFRARIFPLFSVSRHTEPLLYPFLRFKKKKAFAKLMYISPCRKKSTSICKTISFPLKLFRWSWNPLLTELLWAVRKKIAMSIYLTSL